MSKSPISLAFKDCKKEKADLEEAIAGLNELETSLTNALAKGNSDLSTAPSQTATEPKNAYKMAQAWAAAAAAAAEAGAVVAATAGFGAEAPDCPWARRSPLGGRGAAGPGQGP